MGLLSSIFGSSSKNSSSSTSTSSTSNKAINVGVQGDSNSPIIADNTGSIHIERLDNDVIEDVFDFAKLVNRNASEDLSELGGVLTGGFETALNASKSSDERNTQDLFKLMRLAVIIGGAAFVFSKMKFSK